MGVEAYVHIVLDAYRGDVVSLPGRLELVGDGPAVAGEHGPPVTVRVTCVAEPRHRPRAGAWRVRLVGPKRALYARTSDGTLESLRWDDGGFTVTLRGDVAAVLGAGRRGSAGWAVHVLLAPEAERP